MAADQAPPKNTNVTGGARPADTPEFPSAFSLFKPSWEGLQQNLLELIVIFIVPTLVMVLLASLAGFRDNSGDMHHVSGGLGIVVAVLAILYAALLGPAIVHIQLKSSKHEKATYASAWATSAKYWLRFLALSIMVGVTVLVGFILLIVPGIIFLKRYYLSHYALIDQDLGLVESMKKSNELSRNRSGTIYGLIGVEILINIPSVIPIIGQIISFILQIAYFCAPAIRYQQLKAAPAAEA